MLALFDRIIGKLFRNQIDWKSRSGQALHIEMITVLSNAYRSGLIKTVYDIGAHKGRWAASLHCLLPRASLFLFEANPMHRRELEASGFAYHIGVLSRSGVDAVEFYSLPDDAGSTGGSVFKENTGHYKDVEPVTLPAETLSNVVRRRGFPLPDFIKIDAQGSELDIIAGAQDIFRNARYILLEMPVLEYNRGAPSFDAYQSALLQLGFVPISISEIHRYGPAIIQMDFLFAAKELIDRNDVRDFIDRSSAPRS